jgi:hypothetical protein
MISRRWKRVRLQTVLRVAKAILALAILGFGIAGCSGGFSADSANAGEFVGPLFAPSPSPGDSVPQATRTGIPGRLMEP